MKAFILLSLMLLATTAVIAEEPYRLEIKGPISLSNRDTDKVSLWFHCTKWDTETENFRWALIISQNDKIVKISPIGVGDGPINSGFSGGLDNAFFDLPTGDYVVVAKFKDQPTNSVKVKVVK